MAGCAGVYNGVPRAKGRNQRPGLDMMLKDASRGRFDMVLAWALDRLGRSLIDLLGTLGELDGAAVARSCSSRRSTQARA